MKQRQEVKQQCLRLSSKTTVMLDSISNYTRIPKGVLADMAMQDYLSDQIKTLGINVEYDDDEELIEADG
jgi:hypothetical protein|tara:strand:+ start:1043 stop:1252 length:210 start_codon:yes stop_codon:yes gene_type:complete